MALNNHYHNTLYQNDVQKECLFEKSLTPSDVGKLNRLVIPKQHAEKYFPLSNEVVVGETTEKGMVLSFEDESGKCWKFRYSYWNSSQSYVLTKGWSRYVKDKHLDAGDVVFFQRHRFDIHRLFIGWRRRGQPSSSSSSVVSQDHHGLVNTTSFWNGFTSPYRQVLSSNNTCPNLLQDYSSHFGAVAEEAPTVVVGSSKTVRLFGVNLECHNDDVEPPPSPPHIYYYSNPHQMNI